MFAQKVDGGSCLHPYRTCSQCMRFIYLCTINVKVLELRPKVDWNKGSAVTWILDALGLGTRGDVFPIYLGDDITDEDAFVALENR